MADIITIDHILQFIHYSPQYKTNRFTLKSIEYFDVNVWDLEYTEFSEEHEELYFSTIDTENDIEINFQIYRTISHVVLIPQLKMNIEHLELFGKKSSLYNIHDIQRLLRVCLNFSIELVILDRFVDGDLNELWNIKPKY